MSAESTAGSLLTGARCARHASRVATGMCARCGDYVCGACGRRAGERLFCEGCAERTRIEHSPRAVRGFVLGLLGVHGLFVLAPVALVLSLLELAAIKSGHAPLGGNAFARAGVWLGVSGIALPLSALVLWAVLR